MRRDKINVVLDTNYLATLTWEDFKALQIT